jgi:PAS domain S-box-containing protein
MDSPPANRMRVLIVEDDQVTAKNLEAILRRRGFLVIGPAPTAETALTMAREEGPQLALVDVGLTSIDSGINLAEKLKNDLDVPVVFVTGFSEEALFEKASQARPLGFLRKPFSEAELIVCLGSVLERDRAGEGLDARLPGIRSISDNLSDAVIVSDLSGNVRYLNSAAEKLTGWSSSDACEESLGKVVVIGASEASQPSSIDSTEPTPRRVTLEKRDIGIVRVEERITPVKTADGDVVGLITILADLSDEETPESQSESVDPPLNEQEDSDKPAPHPPARVGALKKIAAISNDPAFRRLIADKPLKEKAKSGHTHQGAKTADSSQKLVEPLRSRIDESSPLIDEFGDPLIMIGEGGTIRYANPEAVSVFGGGNNLIGLSFWDRFSNEEFERYEKSLHKPFLDGRRHRFDFHDSARGRWFEVRVYRCSEGVLALFTDITARQLEQADNIRNQRLEGLGLLARGFAHDFNNHLTTITGNISLARERQPEDSEMQQMLSEAQTAASRATGLVQQLMTFAQGGRPIRKRTRIPDLIRRILTDHRLQHPEIRYQFQGAESDLVANVDPAQISRLVENLIANSALAMDSGGVLIVRCATILPDEVKALKETHAPTCENHMLIEVIDTGHGMSEDALGRVFEPYFTTRDEDNATGIGLTVCESIAKAHGGFVLLQSKEGKGTIASFCAPLGHHPDTKANAVGFTTNEEEILSPPPLQTHPHITQPSESTTAESVTVLVGTRILILEDDAPIRRLMAATLRRAGHEVVETKDGQETIALYRDSMETGQKFHLLICDLTIENGVGGVETMRQLTQMDPSILAIVSSGYSDAPAMSSPASFGFSGVLPKPYAPSELRAAVHRMLSAHHIIS